MNTNILMAKISTAYGMRRPRHLKSKPQFATAGRQHQDDCKDANLLRKYELK